MSPAERFKEILEADQAGWVAWCRELCEAYLVDHPEKWPVRLILANQLTALRLYPDSEHCIGEAEKFVPEGQRHLALAERGHLLQAQGRLAEAEAIFLLAHDCDPDDATYLIYAGCAASDQGEIERSLDHYTRATDCRVGCLDEAHFNRGGKLLALKRYKEAADAYREALRIDPDDELALKRLRDVEMLLERHPSRSGV